jgi:hypothetical protein
MNWNLVLLLLRKDLQRLWPFAALACVLLALLVRADQWRMDSMPSPMEGWMNLALPVAWALLAALAVLQDPLVGDDAFWMTRPYGWPTLLTAKVLFVILSIHAPLLLADVLVLQSHGFFTVQSLSTLLVKQLWVFGALTLPAMAIATLVRTLAHFVAALFAVTALLAFLSGGLQSFPNFMREAHEFRNVVVRTLLATGGLTVAVLQYSQRGRALPSRLIGVAAALVAAIVFQYFPLRAEYTAAPVAQRTRLEMRTADADEKLPAHISPWGRSVLLPVQLTPANSSGDAPRVEAGEVELITEDGGDRLVSEVPGPRRPPESIDLWASLYGFKPGGGSTGNWYSMSFSSRAWERWKNRRVYIRGWVGIGYYRTGPTTELSPANSAPKEVPGVGRCAVTVTEAGFNPSPLLKILCESSEAIPPTTVKLSHSSTQGIWQGVLGDAQPMPRGPNRIWLSPVQRALKYFHLSHAVTVDGVDGSARWMMPAHYLSTAKIEVTPNLPGGRERIQFDFGLVKLGDLRALDGLR